MTRVPLGELMPSGIPSVNPAQFPNETFELWSIPAFDVGRPEIATGANIGSSKKCVEPGDVLLSRIVPHIRRSWVVAPSKGGRQIGSGEWITFRSSRFHPPYLRHVLISDEFHACFMQTVAGVGGSLLRARPDGVKEIEIPLPSLDEQRRIAAILDQADSLRRLRQRAIDRLNGLGQAIFKELFGSMNSDYSPWPIICFSDLAESAQIGLVRSANDTGDEFDVPYVRMDAIQRDGLLNLAAVKRTHATTGEKETFSLRAGDFLFNTRNSRELVGKTAVVERDYLGVYNNNILRVRFKSGISSEYVHAYFRQPVAQREIEARKSGTTSVFAIYQKNLATLPVPVPPSDLQAAFSARVRSVNASRAMYVQSLDRHTSLFASLQHPAFRGEL